jgi:hypothetical protein
MGANGSSFFFPKMMTDKSWMLMFVGEPGCYTRPETNSQVD